MLAHANQLPVRDGALKGAEGQEGQRLGHFLSEQQQEHRKHAPDLRDWYNEHKQTLEGNPYAQNRRLNERFATHLLTLLKKQPESWTAINYLNLGENTNDHSFAKYLDNWYQNTPKPYKDTVAKIQQIIKK